MNLNHLTDKELIDYTIKFSDDPEKIRLATAMERIEGAIIDDLVDAGMNETWCTFTSEYGGDYHPGRYIMHLEDEIKIRDDEIHRLLEELEERKALTIANLIVELTQQIETSKWLIKEARQERDTAVRESELAKKKMKVWNAIATE